MKKRGYLIRYAPGERTSVAGRRSPRVYDRYTAERLVKRLRRQGVAAHMEATYYLPVEHPWPLTSIRRRSFATRTRRSR